MVAFRRFVSFLLIIALVALVAILLLKNNLNEQVRRIVEKKNRTGFFEGGNNGSTGVRDF